LGAEEVGFTLDDRSEGWLALGDRDQLDQVLWAMLENALRYGARSPIDVTIRLEAESSDVLMTIADHGPGVAEADRERLFGRFERGADRPSGEGSGLGLYVSRELCRAMGGDLELEPPTEGGGAEFTIRLPAEAPEES
jgi:signal transduction histidine kinase